MNRRSSLKPRLWQAALGISVLILGAWVLMRPTPRRAALTSTRDGGAHVTGLSAVPVRVLPIADAGRRPTAGGLTEPPEDEETVSGRVLAPDGGPAADVMVVAVGFEEVRTGPDGRFRFQLETGRRVRIEASHSALGSDRVEVKVPARGVVLLLSPRAGFDFHVSLEGRPQAGREIRLTPDEREVYISDTLTDDEGRLRMLGLPAGRYVARVWDATDKWFGEVRAEAIDGRITPVEIEVQPLGRIEGVVVAEDGRPVQGATVGAEAGFGGPSDSRGHFEVRGLPLGRSYTLEARSDDASTRQGVAARPGDTSVRLVVVGQPVYHGRVVERSGAPIRSFTIGSRSFDADDGRFSVAGWPYDGKAQFIVTAPGHYKNVVEVEPSQADLGDIALDRAPAIIGRVVNEQNQPVAGAFVDGPSPVLSEADGTFRFEQGESPWHPERTVTVRAQKDSRVGWAEIHPGTSSDIVLHGEKLIRGRVLLPDGRPMPEGFVRADGVKEYRWRLAGDGTFEGRAADGIYSLRVEEGWDDRTWFAQLPPSEELLLGPGLGRATLELDLPAGVDTVWIDRGQSTPGIGGWAPQSEGQRVSRPGLHVRFVGVRSGTWTVVVATESGERLRQVVNVSGDASMRFTPEVAGH